MLFIKLKYNILEDFSSNFNMNNFLANITKFQQLQIDVYGSDNLINGNFRRYSNQPKAPEVLRLN